MVLYKLQKLSLKVLGLNSRFFNIDMDFQTDKKIQLRVY